MLSRASSCLFVFKLRAHWLLDICSIPLIGCSWFSDLQSKCSPTNPEEGLRPRLAQKHKYYKTRPRLLICSPVSSHQAKMSLTGVSFFFFVDKLYCYSAILTYSCFKIGWVFTVPGMEM